jgi:hypothetical protein
MADPTSNVPAVPKRRLVLNRKQHLTYSTAIFYLQSKPTVDEEYRRIVELMLDTLVRSAGIGGQVIADLVVEDEERGG